MLIKLPHDEYVDTTKVVSVKKNENDYCVVMVATVDGQIHRCYVPCGTPGGPDQLKAAQQKLLDEIVNLINGPSAMPLLASSHWPAGTIVDLPGFSANGPWVDLQAQLDNLKAMIDSRRQVVRDFSDSLKGGQGTTPPVGEVRPAAPPSPPMKSGFDFRQWVERRKASRGPEDLTRLNDEIDAAMESGQFEPTLVNLGEIQSWCSGDHIRVCSEVIGLLVRFVADREYKQCLGPLSKRVRHIRTNRSPINGIETLTRGLIVDLPEASMTEAGSVSFFSAIKNTASMMAIGKETRLRDEILRTEEGKAFNTVSGEKWNELASTVVYIENWALSTNFDSSASMGYPVRVKLSERGAVAKSSDFPESVIQELIAKNEIQSTSDGVQVAPVKSKFARPFERCDPLRGTGRSTAGMLKTIAHALECPGEWVPFIDHGMPTIYAAKRQKHHLEYLTEILKLDMSVEHVRNSPVCRVKSNVDRKDIGIK